MPGVRIIYGVILRIQKQWISKYSWYHFNFRAKMKQLDKFICNLSCFVTSPIFLRSNLWRIDIKQKNLEKDIFFKKDKIYVRFCEDSCCSIFVKGPGSSMKNCNCFLFSIIQFLLKQIHSLFVFSQLLSLIVHNYVFFKFSNYI